jgi:hypothetical protein
MSTETTEVDVEEESSPQDNGWKSPDDVNTESEEPEAQEVEAEEEAVDSEEEEPEVQGQSEEVQEEEEQEEPATEKAKPAGIPFKRFNQVLQRAKEAEEKLKAQNEQKVEPLNDGELKMPDLTYDAETDRKNQEEYFTKKAALEAQKIKDELRNEQLEKQRQEKAQAEQQRIEAAIKEDPEYNEVLLEIQTDEEGAFIEEYMTQEVYSAIQEYGTQFEKHVLKNRHELLPKLKGLPGWKQGVEIDKILGSLSPEKEEVKPKEIKSKAPKVIKTAKTGGNAFDFDGWKEV